MATSLVGLTFFARRTNDASVMLPLSQPLVIQNLSPVALHGTTRFLVKSFE